MYIYVFIICLTLSRECQMGSGHESVTAVLIGGHLVTSKFLKIEISSILF